MSEIKVNSIKGVGASAAAISVDNTNGTCTLASGSKLNNCTTDGTTNLTIADGNLVVSTNGHGIDFSAATGSATGSTGAILDDYEEGTWTVSFDTNAGTNTSNNCFYIKVGNIVTAFFRGTHPSTSSSSYASLTDLPFTSFAAAVGVPGGAFSETNAGENLHTILNPNANYAYILKCDASGVAVVTQSSISGKDFRGSITYRTQ